MNVEACHMIEKFDSRCGIYWGNYLYDRQIIGSDFVVELNCVLV